MADPHSKPKVHKRCPIGQVPRIHLVRHRDTMGGQDDAPVGNPEEPIIVEVGGSPSEPGVTPALKWTVPDRISVWARIFRLHRNTMRRRLQTQAIKNEKVGHLYKVAVEDLPANQHGK